MTTRTAGPPLDWQFLSVLLVLLGMSAAGATWAGTMSERVDHLGAELTILRSQLSSVPRMEVLHAMQTDKDRQQDSRIREIEEAMQKERNNK